MKSKSAVLLLMLLLLAIDKASAQTPLTALDEKTYTDKVPPIQKGERVFSIEPSYVLKEMVAGRDVKLIITIKAEGSGAGFLELKDLPVITSQDAADKFTFKNNGMEDREGVVHIRKYNFIVRLGDKVEPRRHQVALGFALQGSKAEDVSMRYFDLNVGVTNGGKLAPVPPDEDSQSPSFETGLFAGKQHTYELNLQNSFPDYTVSIESIKIQSDPAGLIEPKDFVYENGISLLPGEQKTIPLEFKTTPLGIWNLIKGLRTTPRFKAEVFYNDGNERRITDFKPRLAISIPPTNQVLVSCVFLGLLFGAVIRTVLEFMLFKKQITRRGVIKVVSYSLLFGLLLVIFVAVGQVEIKAKTFSMSSSYDNPLAMLVIGLIGALAGMQMIIGWYKSLKTD
jgi:hypothetical protein